MSSLLFDCRCSKNRIVEEYYNHLVLTKQNTTLKSCCFNCTDTKLSKNNQRFRDTIPPKHKIYHLQTEQNSVEVDCNLFYNAKGFQVTDKNAQDGQQRFLISPVEQSHTSSGTFMWETVSWKIYPTKFCFLKDELFFWFRYRNSF